MIFILIICALIALYILAVVFNDLEEKIMKKNLLINTLETEVRSYDKYIDYMWDKFESFSVKNVERQVKNNNKKLGGKR